MSTQQILPPPGEFKTTEEIRDARFAERLARRRRLLLWWSAPVVLLAFAVALKFISAVIINTAGISAYGNENHNTAANRFSNLEVVNVVEPWKPYFNAGTAIYASGDFFGATVPLATALDLVPKAPETEPRGELECAVRTNYSLSLEGLGDEAMLAEDPGTALDYYDQAQEMLADCAEDGGGGGEEAEEADERQQESQDQAEEQQEQQEQDQQDGEGGEGEQDQQEQDQNGQEDEQDQQDGQEDEQDPQDGEGTEDEETDPSEEELEERNRQAQEEREQQEQQDDGGDGSGQNW